MNWSTFRVLSLAAAMACSAPAFAGKTGPVTFTKDVLPILQENCQDCHRPNGANLGGMVAPMAFMNYGDTRPWAKAIAKNVASGKMPPWHASDEFHGVFENERVLTQEQIDTIVEWVKTGARRGNPADAPAPREFPSGNGWQIGAPDLVVQMPEPYFVEDDVEDQYVTFYTKLTEEMLPEDRYIKTIEFRPGSSIVHHIISEPLGGIAPGNDPTVFPDGYAQILRKGSSVSWQMHYHKEPGPGTGVWDQSMAGIKFYPKGEKPEHIIHIAPLGNFDFEIPPYDPNYTAEASKVFEEKIQVIGYTPHMHLRGKSAVYTATYPDGNMEKLLEVPEYDFNWQTTYRYPQPKILPAGTEVHLAMAWDNSENNPYNPDPSATVRFGEPTTAEMMFGFMTYAYADEPEQVVLSEEVLEQYEGTYQMGPNFTFTVQANETYLSASMGDRPPVELTTRAKDKFFLGLIGMELTFERDADGRVEAVRIQNDDGMNLRAMKAQPSETAGAQ